MLKTKEFADLCGTTKETLFHYDRIGLLKPARVLDNGYRLWSTNQRAKFFLVSLLKESGCSLKEIEAMCGTGSEAQTLNWLKQCKKQMKKQIALLKNGYAELTNLIDGLEALSEVSWNELRFEKCPADKYRLVPTPADVIHPDMAEAAVFDALSAEKKKVDGSLRTVGRLVDRKAAEAGKLRILGFIFALNGEKDWVTLKFKSGKYGVWYTKGLPEKHISETQLKLFEIRNSGHKCVSEVFVFQQPDLSLDSDSDELTAKYMVLVE